MLDVLVFTDSSAEESLSGSPGFQFVAQSPGTSPTDENIVKQQQHLLPSGLSEDSWEDHPATCGYARSGNRMYLSRGHSTGKTLGGRPGNQLTVTLMTSEPFDILPLRPAQLYSSPAWDLSRPASKILTGWETPVEIDKDFDIPGLHTLIIEDPWAVSVLPSVLTMLDHTQAERRKRLLIRHSDQALVMRWVALLSHFLDPERALGFEFRVFTDAPLGSNQHVVGVHPLIAPDLTVDVARKAGLNMLDLERRESTPVTPSESATRYAKWFVSGDPYEALEAIEVGRRWSHYMDPHVAAKAAELATMSSSPGGIGKEALTASLVALSELAKGHQRDELDTYGDSLADVVASSRPTDSSDLLLIDVALWNVTAVSNVELAQSLAVTALEWVAVQPGMLSPWSASSSAPSGTVLTWPSNDLRAHAAHLLATGLNVVEDGVLPAAFTLAHALNTGVSTATVGTAIHRLADIWSVNPTLTPQASEWLHREATAAQLEDVLNARLTAGDPGTIDSWRRGDWDWLFSSSGGVSAARPMSGWIAIRELDGAGPKRREEILATVGSWLPNNAWQKFLPQNGELAAYEVSNWIKSHGDLDPGLGTEIIRILSNVHRFPNWRRADGGALVLHQIGGLNVSLPAALRDYVSAQKQILELFKIATQSQSQSSNMALRQLQNLYPRVLNGLYGDWIAEAVLTSYDTAAAIALAEGEGRAAVIACVREELEEQLRAPEPTAMLSAARLLNPSLGPWSTAAQEALNAVWDDPGTEAIREWLLSTVNGRLTRDQYDWLGHYLDTQSKGRFTRGVMRGAKAAFAGRGRRSDAEEPRGTHNG